MTAVRAFHVGILVANMEEAIPRFETVLGIHFRAPRWGNMPHLESTQRPEPHEYRGLFAYSVEGPPYIELIQADETEFRGLWQGERIHHIGVWLPEAGERMRSLVEQGAVRVEALTKSATGMVRMWFNDPATLHGVRIEFMDESIEPAFEQWATDPDAPTGGIKDPGA